MQKEKENTHHRIIDKILNAYANGLVCKMLSHKLERILFLTYSEDERAIPVTISALDINNVKAHSIIQFTNYFICIRCGKDKAEYQ